MQFEEKCKFLEEKGLNYLEIADVLDSEYNVVRMVIEDELEE